MQTANNHENQINHGSDNKMKSFFLCLIFCLFGWINLSYLNAQTMNDIDTVWTAAIPERSYFIDVITLQNGNYLVYGYNGYLPTSILNPNNSLNISGANTNEIYIAEFTESGNILRYKTIQVNMPTTDYTDQEGRNYISNPRVIERPDRGLLILSEFEHGGGETGYAYMATASERFHKIILDENWTVTYNGLHGIQVNNFTYNNITYDYVRGIRLLHIQHTSDGRVLSCFTAYKNLSGTISVLQGAIFLDYDGNISGTPQNALKVIEINGTTAMTGATKCGTYYLFTEGGDRIWRSTDLQCNGFIQLPNLSCPQCHIVNYSKSALALPNNGGFIVHSVTGHAFPPNNDQSNQYALWRWDGSSNILTPSPYWFADNRHISGFTLMNNATYDNLNQDHYLVKSVTYQTNSSTVTSVKISEFVFSSTGVTFTEGPDLSAPNLSMCFPSLDNSGIIAGGTTIINNETRMLVGKLSMCKGFTLTPSTNKSYVSGGSLPAFTFDATGAYQGATISYSWRIVLKSGSLSSHPTATVGTVLASGTNNTIPSSVYSVNNSLSESATLLIEYAATQTWGTPQQVCKTTNSYEIQLQYFLDNVSDAECYIDPPATEWSINLYLDYDSIYTEQTPLVGDMDGDGYPDIFLKSVEGIGTMKNFVILRGPDFETPIKYTTDVLAYSSEAIARIKWNGATDSVIIVVMTTARLLKAYNIRGNLLWTSSTTVFNPSYATGINARAIGFADFDNDGYTEVYVGNQIFDAVTGVELCNGGSNNKGLALYGSTNSLFSIAMDVIGDRRLELCAGNQVYEVNIDRANSSLNSMNVVKQVTPVYNSTTLHNDGATIVADFDNDGELEILVQTQANATSVGYLYIWKPATEQTLVVHQLTDAAQRNVPFVGDINGDGKVEIVALTANGSNRYMRAFALTGNTLNQLWQIDHTDNSGSTGLTLFDFNQDGIAEIVYRDEDNLRIINGSLKSHFTGNDTTAVYNLYSTPAYSGTVYEYPVVADVDGDGHAEILTTSAINPGNKYNDMNGKLFIFKGAANSPGSPARKVWNQYMFNVINVNEDLTIPQYQFNPATIFLGNDNIIGTSDDIRPYNAFLQQQTRLNKGGAPLWLAPDAKFSETPVYNYYGNGDSLVISTELTNIGDAALSSPFYISAYKNSVAAANKMATNSSMMFLNVKDDTMTVTLTIRNFSSYKSSPDLTSIIIRINDKGSAAYVQQECEYDNNVFTVPFANLLMAQDDYAATIGTMPVRIEVLANDLIPSGCTPTLSIVAPLAKHGGATIVRDSVQYAANAGFVGYDTVTYQIVCGANSSTANVIVRVQKFPDNVDDADCVVEPTGKEWTIKRSQRLDSLATICSFVVGDINDDGYPDIVGYGDKNCTSIRVFRGPDFSTNSKYSIATSNYANKIAIAKVKISDSPDMFQTMIYYRASGRMYAMKPDGTPAWASNPTCRYPGATGVADFNNDGWSEIYTGNQIYDAATGKLLCDGGTSENSGKMYVITLEQTLSMAIDILGDEKLELVAGNKIYGVDIDRSVTTPKPLTVLSSVTPPTSCPNDGVTVVADFNNDGKLEVLVRRRQLDTDPVANNYPKSNHHLYLWSPHTGTSTGKILAKATDNNTFAGIPFIGDIDGDGKPEIVSLDSNGSYNTQTGFKARKYNETTGAFDLFWDINHVDNSGATGMTLFDFNNDGISEIVYRDEQVLRIINGSKKHHITGASTNVYTLNSFTSYSGTGTEYPVIVDIYRNGSSAILITSDYRGPRDPSQSDQGFANDARVDIFTSSPSTPWAPARKVWNQYAYNVVNVNEDLTVPAVQLSLATRFPGADGVINTPDDIRPYNAFLQQQTLLNTGGTPLWLTPDAKFSDAPVFNYYGNGDSLVISTKLTNIGDAALNATFYVSAYKNTVAAANKMATDSSKVSLNVDAVDTIIIDVTIRKFSTYTPLNKIILLINDKGSAAYVQQECEYDNNVFEFDPAKLLKAANDTVATLLNTPVFVDVKLNDLIPAYCSSVIPEIAVNPSEGDAEIVNDSIKYTPDNDFYGVDSLVYRLTCTLNDTVYNTKAKVYIVVNKPKSDTYIACAGEKTTAGFETITNVTYHWYADETGGVQDVASNTRDCEAPSVWWVEARYKSKPAKPRMEVTIDEYPDLDLTGFSIEKDATICHGSVPAQLKATGSPSGGDGVYAYQWQESSNNVVWNDVKDSINTTLTPSALTSDMYYRLNVTSCTTTESSDTVKITVRSKSLYNYPDIRIRVCPDGTNINLSKYLDTLDLTSIEWKSIVPIIPITDPTSSGTISTNNLSAYTRVHTFTYTVSNLCTSNITRKVYLETLKQGKMRPLRDSIMICHKYAEAVNINQIFGIDAGGELSFVAAYQSDGVTPVNGVDVHLKKSTSSTYNGALIMNGKAIYENTTARKIVIRYTPAVGSCLDGSGPFQRTIILIDE
jgi:hypothetical protein